MSESRSLLRPSRRLRQGFPHPVSAAEVRVRLGLLGAFELVSDGVPVRLPLSAQRVVAFVALHERPLPRAPDWYEDWVLFERERFRQVRLRALDALCDRLTRAGRLNEAMEAALLSVAGDPLRESAQRALVRVHLSEGNAGEAVRTYRLYQRLLHEQLGIQPSERMQELVAGLDNQETAW